MLLLHKLRPLPIFPLSGVASRIFGGLVFPLVWGVRIADY